MDVLQAIVLAIVQGLTEFLPISSSGHLILIPRLLGWQDQGLAFDVAVHLGTVLAVITYFRAEIRDILAAFFRSLSTGRVEGDARLGWAVLLGTLPVALIGWLFGSHVETMLRSPVLIGLATAGFGLLLWLADRYGKRQRDEHHLSWQDVIVVGLAQALALIPGTSRSGITMTAGLMMGLSREAAARFSFLLAIPVIILAGGFETVHWFSDPDSTPWHILVIGALVAGLFAFLCIDIFLKLVERVGMLPFALYRLLLGVLIIYVYF